MADSRRAMVTAVFRDRTHAQDVFAWLHGRGYTQEEMSVLMSGSTRSRYFPVGPNNPKYQNGTAAAEGSAIGGAVGTALGATVAAVAAVGTAVALPGLGLVIAGPLAAAFAGGGAGAVTGGVIGWLAGLGVAEPNARAYEEALREGGMVVGVIPHSGEEAADIRRWFEQHHAEGVYYG